ncbi:MAG: hypothetical protein WCC17_24020 [Candidatus Nitrosopolaris sp.]
MNNQLNQKVETKDEELVRVNQWYRQAQEDAWKADTEISKLNRKVTELRSVISQTDMEEVWIEAAMMKDLIHLAIKKNVSVNDLGRQMIINGLYDECEEYQREKKERAEPLDDNNFFFIE